MYEEIHFRNCYLNSFGKFDPGDLGFWSSDPNINRVPLLPRMDVWTSLRRVGQGILQLFIGNGFGTFDLVTLTFDPVTPVSTGFLFNPRWMCGQCLRKVGEGVLELLIGNDFGTFDPGDLDLWPSDPKINWVPLLPRTDVWTKSRSRRSQVIDRKRKGYRRTDRLTCAKQYALSISMGGHNNNVSWRKIKCVIKNHYNLKMTAWEYTC